MYANSLGTLYSVDLRTRPGSGNRGPKDLGTWRPRDPRTWGPGTQGLTLECTVCVLTVASSLGKYPGPHVERAFKCVGLCLESLEWNADWSSGMGYRIAHMLHYTCMCSSTRVYAFEYSCTLKNSLHNFENRFLNTTNTGNYK